MVKKKSFTHPPHLHLTNEEAIELTTILSCILSRFPAAVLAKFRASGQTCICVNRFFVHSSIVDKFSQRLQKRVRQFKVGSGFDSANTHGPLINQGAVDKVRSHVQDAVKHGAKLLAGGEEGDSIGSNVGYFYPPTVLTGMTASMRMASEETFGPVAGVFSFDTEEEVLQAANNTRFGLAGYFFSQDVSRCWRVAEKLQVGMVGVNTGAISSEVAPFGGVSLCLFRGFESCTIVDSVLTCMGYSLGQRIRLGS